MRNWPKPEQGGLDTQHEFLFEILEHFSEAGFSYLKDRLIGVPINGSTQTKRRMTILETRDLRGYQTNHGEKSWVNSKRRLQ
jgi:hypothetical protein